MKKFKILILAAAALLCTLSAAAETGSTLVFNTGLSNGNGDTSKYWRIPAIVRTGDGRLLAVADDRGNNNYKDPGSHEKFNEASYLVGRYSSDNGRTWSDPVRLFPSFQSDKSYSGLFPSIFPKNLKYSNGDASLCAVGNTVICGFAADGYFGSGCSMYIAKSTDNGETWSTPKKLTFTNNDVVNNEIANASYLSSGHMFYDAERNRIWVCFQGKGSSEHMWVAYSDDLGDTWTVATKSGKKASESKVVKLSDGSLAVSCKTSGKREIVRLNENSDGSWSFGKTISTLTDPQCNGSIIAVNHGGKPYILQSNCLSSAREKITISVSDDDARNWLQDKYQVCAGGAAYSDMIDLGNGEIGILTEEENPNIREYYDLRFHWIDASKIIPQPIVFDGTLQAAGLRYVRIPRTTAATQPWDVQAGGELTITVRAILNDYTGATGLYSSRAYTTDGSDNKDFGNNAIHMSGLEIFGGQNDKGIPGVGLNATPTVSGKNGRIVLDSHMQDEEYMLKRWNHITIVVKPGSGDTDTVATYLNGVLKEWVTTYKGVYNGFLPTTGGNFKNMPVESVLDFLIGSRYNLDAKTGTHEVKTVNGTQTRVPLVDLTNIWHSSIDDLRIYGKALSADQIMQDMNSGFPIMDAGNGLLLAHDFAHASGNSFIDISGNTHNAVQSGRAFPEERNVTVTPVTPDKDGNVEMGTLTVQRFYDGEAHAMKVGQDYTAATYGEDFRVYAEPRDGYELVGIYVNDVPVLNGSFIKSNGDSRIVAMFRPKSQKAFYLVGQMTGNKIDEKYRLAPVTGTDNVFKSATEGDDMLDMLHGKFHIVQLNTQMADGTTYSGDAYYQFGIYNGAKTMADLTEPAEGSADMAVYRMHKWAIHLYATFSQLYFNEKMHEEGEGCDTSIYDRDFTLVYSKDKNGMERKHMLTVANNPEEAYHFRVHPDGETWNGLYPDRYQGAPAIDTYAVNKPTSNAIHKPVVTLYYPANPKEVAAGAAPIDYFTVEYDDVNTGVEDITGEDSDAPVEYFNLGGVRVSGDNLTPGLYIVRQGKTVTKRLIK